VQTRDAIWHRRMTRNFRTDPVPEELLTEILSAATRGPSAGFSQGLDLLVLELPERRARFWELASEERWRASPTSASLLGAPAIVLVIADPLAYDARYAEADKAVSRLSNRRSSEWDVPYPTVDAAFATMLLLLAVEDAGLGALFFQLHATPSAVLDGLDVPSGRTTIGAIAIGYRGDEDPPTSPARRPRRQVDEVVHRETW
jgi:nitroreductase